MPCRLWMEGMSTQVAGLDAEHRAIFAQLELLEDSLQGGNLARAETELTALAQVLGSHFSSEEAWFRLSPYDKLDGHLRAHDAIRKEVCMVQQALALAPLPSEATDLADALKDLLFRHLIVEDMEIKWLALDRGLADGEALLD